MPFYYVHSHVSALNFVLFVIICVLFACPQTTSAFENILVYIKRLQMKRMRKFNLFARNRVNITMTIIDCLNYMIL